MFSPSSSGCKTPIQKILQENSLLVKHTTKNLFNKRLSIYKEEKTNVETTFWMDAGLLQRLTVESAILGIYIMRALINK